MKNKANILFEIHMKELGIAFVPEFKFALQLKRKWRFDYLLWLNTANSKRSIVAVEIEGGIWSRGRHTRPVGYAKDLVKYREATRLGYKVYRFSTKEVLDGTARQFLAQLGREQ